MKDLLKEYEEHQKLLLSNRERERELHAIMGQDLVRERDKRRQAEFEALIGQYLSKSPDR